MILKQSAEFGSKAAIAIRSALVFTMELVSHSYSSLLVYFIETPQIYKTFLCHHLPHNRRWSVSALRVALVNKQTAQVKPSCSIVLRVVLRNMQFQATQYNLAHLQRQNCSQWRR